MITIKKEGWNPDEVIDAVRYLKNLGYEPQTDFDFKYYPPNTYNMAGFWNEDYIDRYVMFTFYKEELASYFLLRFD